jgi:hypothetical protein
VGVSDDEGRVAQFLKRRGPWHAELVEVQEATMGWTVRRWWWDSSRPDRKCYIAERGAETRRMYAERGNPWFDLLT